MTHGDYITADSLQIARLEERMATMERDMRGQSAQLEALNLQMTAILAALNEARGGWRTLMLVGGAVAVLGGALSWGLQHITIKA